MPDTELSPWAERRYLGGLGLLTIGTGAIDAVSYLALDRVFTGNMTGNVLFIGMGLAGASDIPVLNNVVALAAFMVAAVIGGRIVRRTSNRTRVSRHSLGIHFGVALLTALLALVWMLLGGLEPLHMLVITGILATLSGAQASAVRPTRIADMTTVVVTMTIVNLAYGSRLSGGTGANWGRRLLAIVCMGAGAFVSALIWRFGGGASALLFAAAPMLAGAITLTIARAAELRDASLLRQP